MDGDIAPLPQLCDLAEKYNCIMMIDDAHSSGRPGPQRARHGGSSGLPRPRGYSSGHAQQSHRLAGRIRLRFAELIEFLYHRARPFLFSTSHPPSVVATCQAAFELLDSEAGERLIKKLWSNTKFFKRKLKKLGFNTGKSETPITPIMVGDAAKAFEFSRELKEAGVFAGAIGYPTVAEGKARIRTIVTATHKRADLEKAAEIIGPRGKEPRYRLARPAGAHSDAIQENGVPSLTKFVSYVGAGFSRAPAPFRTDSFHPSWDS